MLFNQTKLTLENNTGEHNITFKISQKEQKYFNSIVESLNNEALLFEESFDFIMLLEMNNDYDFDKVSHQTIVKLENIFHIYAIGYTDKLNIVKWNGRGHVEYLLK